MTDIKIVMTGHGRGDVWVDGVEVQATRVSFTAGLDEANRVQLTLLAKSVSIEGPADVVRPRLPWWKRLFAPARSPGSTPPAGWSGSGRVRWTW